MQSLQFAFGTHFFADMVFEDANWDFRKFKLDQDTKLADEKMARFSTPPILTCGLFKNAEAS